MKILMTADTLGGVWTFAMELCAALRAYRVEIALATLGGALSRAQRTEVRRLSNVHLFESEYRLEWMPDPWESLAAAGEWLLDIKRQIRPDLVHLNHLVHGDLPWRCPAVVVGHSCVNSWWKAVCGGKPDASWDVYRARVTRSLRCADAVIAPSQNMLDALCEHYGPLQRTQVIYNARNPELHRPASKEKFLFSAGRLWDEAKNMALLCEVAPSLPWPVFVAGDDTGPNGHARSLPHITRLGHLGPQAISEWLSCASVYVAPARYEPFGLGALEAGLSGCALVLSDLESLREIWKDAALYFSPDSTTELRETLLHLLADAQLLNALGARARARASHFHPSRFAASYLNLYRSLSRSEESASCVSYCSITH